MLLHLLLLQNLLWSRQIRSCSGMTSADTDMQEQRSPAMGQSCQMLSAQVKLHCPSPALGFEAGSVLQAGQLGS